jgi:hypothetical protein
MDVTETPMERPQKKQKDFFSGKRGYHTKSVEYRLLIEERHSCNRQEAKGDINTQFLITRFSIIL